jgi:ATP-dependent RNA helicase DDX46/PRP5
LNTILLPFAFASQAELNSHSNDDSFSAPPPPMRKQESDDETPLPLRAKGLGLALNKKKLGNVFSLASEKEDDTKDEEKKRQKERALKLKALGKLDEVKHQKKTSSAPPPSSSSTMSDDVDPLEAFMVDVNKEVANVRAVTSQANTSSSSSASSTTNKSSAERFFKDEDTISQEEITAFTEKTNALIEKQKRAQKKDLKPIDYSKVELMPFRKSFYIEAKEISSMTDEEVKEYRAKELENVKITGKDCPRPIKKWIHAGLPPQVHELIAKEKFEKPFPIQCQAIPVIMSGRDCIGCAKTVRLFLLFLFRFRYGCS